MNQALSVFQIDTLLTLLLIASATAVVIKWIRIPYAVALVIAGLAIGLSKVLPPVSLTPDLVLVIFLPALLFEASWNMDIKTLRRDWLAISALATLGVVVCMFGVAAILHLSGGMTVHTAFLFGAMIAATDPISVIALFRKMGIDKRLTMILEGESLFNDGTAVVLFKIVLALVISGSAFSPINAIGAFCVSVFGGSLIGALIGYIASRITSAFDDHLLEITLTTVTAYGSYLAADHLRVSPVMAVVAAGIVVGNFGSRTGMSATTRLAVNSFWEYAAFLVNSLLFLLIGLQVQVPIMVEHANLIGLAVVAVICARLLVIYGICPFVSTQRLPIPDSWRHLLFWGGLRGALVMALALSVPLSVPDCDIIINMAFGVVLFTLLVPGLTMEPLVRLLNMVPKHEKLSKFQELRSLVLAYRAELAELDAAVHEKRISPHAHDQWKHNLEFHIASLEAAMEKLELSDSSIDELQDRQAKVRFLQHRKDHLAKLEKEGSLSHESFQKLNLAIDAELDYVASDNSHSLEAVVQNSSQSQSMALSIDSVESDVEASPPDSATHRILHHDQDETRPL